MGKKTGRTSSKNFPGWYVNFQAAALMQLPRPDEIDQIKGEGWTRNQRGLKKFLKGLCPLEVVGKFATQTEFLRFISGSETLILDPCDGTDIIPGSSDMFEAGIDSDFVNYGADEKGPATGETEVGVYELIKDANFVDMFGSLSNIEKLCPTQAQIKNFIRKHRKWLRADGYATLFPFKSRRQFFVARVHVDSSSRLYVLVGRFVYSSIWDAYRRLRVVVPQLAKKL